MISSLSEVAQQQQVLTTHTTTHKHRGRCTYTAGLDAEGLDLAFGPEGATYALLTANTVTLHDAGGEGGLAARVDSEEVRLSSLMRTRQDER